VLWGILAPIVAILVLSPRESTPWFAAHVVLLAICGFIDFQLVDAPATIPRVPPGVSRVFFVLNFTAISSIAYFLLHYATRQKQIYQSEFEQTHHLLQLEQEKSERLLLNILPGPVAKRLKQEGATIVDGFADVTVMFADIVNFTSIAEGMSPKQVFSMLNKVFSGFDTLAEKHQVEKIKTIGDAYMAAGGLNSGEGPNYTEKIADLAIDMHAMLAHDPAIKDMGLKIRVGVGTGPIVAGVVGTKKFSYDLWGDTVNIASRITAEGAPGVIQVDATTYRRLRDRYDFDLPQNISLRGKGDVAVFRLIGRKTTMEKGTGTQRETT
jgi:adenylate cyclase